MFAIVVLVLALAVITCNAVSPCEDGTVVGMADPGSIVGGRDIRPTYGRGYVMTNPAYVSQCCGVVKGWTFAVDSLALPNPIELLVWRPTDRAATYKLVGRNTYYAKPSYPTGPYLYGGSSEGRYSSGSREFDVSYDDDDDGYIRRSSNIISIGIPDDERISIRAGDVIGWRSPSGDLVAYTTKFYNLDNIIVNNMPAMEVGEAFMFPRPLKSHRTYGINAVLTKGAAPELTNLPATVDVKVDAVRGTVVFRVTGRDVNPGDEIVYVITGPDEIPFQIDSHTGDVILEGELAVTTYNVQIAIADDCGLFDVAVLAIRVPKPNTAPKILNMPSLVTVPWSKIGEELVHSFDVYDDDGDDVLCYVSDVRPYLGVFFLNDTSLYAMAQSHEEVRYDSIYTITVVCSDDDDDTMGIIEVRFIQRQPPEFVNPSAVTYLSGFGYDTDDVVYVIKAKHNGTSSLMFYADDCFCPLHLNPDGTVVLRDTLKREPVTSYTLNVYVTDGTVTVGPEPYIFRITEVNQPPEFHSVPSSLLVEENSSGNLLYINVSDPDDNHTLVSVSWIPPDAQRYFFFNTSSSSIEIQTNASLDFETLNNLNMTTVTAEISASDGFKTSSVNVTITISDVNEPPFCTQSRFSVTVTEGKRGTMITENPLASACTDPESRSLVFSVPDDSSSSHFTVDSSNASLSFVRDIFVDSPTVVSVPVTVSDVDGLNVTVIVDVTIENMNRAPQLVNVPRTIAISEKLAPGSDVFTVVTKDADIDDVTVRFRVIQGEAGLFEIRDHTLFLRPEAKLDFETFPIILIEFTADDGDLTSDPALLTLEILDMNEPPEFEIEELNITLEESKAGTAVSDTDLRNFVSDPDVNDTLHFSILPANFSEYFTINSTSGQLHFAKDYDTDPERLPAKVTLSLEAKDSGSLSDTIIVNLHVTNVNQAPVIENLPNDIYVSEDLPTGSVVFQVTAQDRDTQNVISFSGVFVEGKATKFSFNESDGSLTLIQELDFETEPFYSIEVHATDGELASSAEKLNIYVTDVNEAPVFTRDTFYITAEEGPAGTVIGNGEILASVLDPDNDPLTFDLAKDTSESSRFSINTETAELIFAEDFVLTRETSPEIEELVIRVTDTGNLSATARVNVTVYDVNTRPRILFLPANISVSEDANEGTLLYKIFAEDEDGDELEFQFTSVVGGGQTMFHLNSTTGELRLLKGARLNMDTTDFYKLELSVSDGQLTSAPTYIGIFVVRRDDVQIVTSPTFVISVSEDDLFEPLQIPQFWSTSENLNSSAPVTISITGGNGLPFFDINADDGTLFFNGGFDIDDDPLSNATLTLEVTAEDVSGRNQTAFINVMIDDVNDNAPKVASDLVTLFVDKNSPVGTVIGYVDARDYDRGVNAEMEFKVVGSSLADNSVQITPSGALFLNGSLSSVVEPSARLEVRVSDRGAPPLSTTVGVFIIFVGPNPPGSSEALKNSGKSGKVEAEVTPVAVVTVVALAVAIAASAFAYVCGRRSARRQTNRNEEFERRPEEEQHEEEAETRL